MARIFKKILAEQLTHFIRKLLYPQIRHLFVPQGQRQTVFFCLHGFLKTARPRYFLILSHNIY
ncbi:hypothetical protein DWUX_1203 [Desulfovibrio diazotrophicus]|nr:hypothetical protein DWUX_1203 [Desulfovibrio diazotrophicus]